MTYPRYRAWCGIFPKDWEKQCGPKYTGLVPGAIAVVRYSPLAPRLSMYSLLYGDGTTPAPGPMNEPAAGDPL